VIVETIETSATRTAVVESSGGESFTDGDYVGMSDAGPVLDGTEGSLMWKAKICGVL
jgi:hypothetical protein